MKHPVKPKVHHRISYNIRSPVPNWAHVEYCRRSRAAEVIQQEVRYRFQKWHDVERERQRRDCESLCDSC